MSHGFTTRSAFVFTLFALLSLFHTAGTHADEWPGFRGPDGNGLSEDKDLPVKWSANENVAWKARLPGPGASSPIVWKDRVFVTCWSGYADGESDPGDMNKLVRHLVCLDRNSGKILWKKDVPAKLPEIKWAMAISQHGYTTNTPATDGERVYVFFGKSGVLAFDFDGKQLWQTDVGKWINSFGSGSSPLLYKDLVIINASVEGTRLVALDKTTGKEVWKIKLYEDCWTTPFLAKGPDGRQELIMMTPEVLRGLDPATGKELWTCEAPEAGSGYVSANPVAANGIVYIMGSGNVGKVCMAVRLGGKGDVTKTHLLWKQKVGASLCSPILVGQYLYFFSGLAHCIDTKTGDIVFRERLPGLGREYASPVAADGKIYLFTRDGTGHVLAAEGKFTPLAQNRLDDSDSFVASPAIHRGQILVRTNTYLYCLGKSKSK